MTHVTEPVRRGRTLPRSQPARRDHRPEGTELPEGREIAWTEWGPEHGLPVLFCPGAGTSSALGFGAAVLDALGVRLIALDRPGLGGSDPDPTRTLTSWADDVRALIAERALHAPRIIGFSQGAPFALACAAAGLVTHAAIVSGSDELASPHVRAALVPDVSAMVERVLRDPRSAETFFSQMSASTMRNMVLTMSSDIDRKVYEDPAFDTAFTRALEEGFSQGAAGYARDTILAMSPWPFDLARIEVPVDLWYGALDTSPVHSPDFGRSLAARIPTAQWHLLPDAGGALLWTHAERILRSLLADS